MSNSSLVSYTKISPNKTSPRNHKIDTITIHCVVGQLSAESICGCFTNPDVQASCNYGIGTDGRISLCVEEKDRSWCSSNKTNDHRAVTIECASDKVHPYAINDKVYASLIELCTDICQRNGIKVLKWKADKSLIGQPEKQNMTVHRWFANKDCPGDYIYARLDQIAAEVNARLNAGLTSSFDHLTDTSTNKGNYPATPFTVRVRIDNLNYRSMPSMNGEVEGQIGKGVFTIVEVKDSWGKLKSGAGWIWLGNVSYCTIQEDKMPSSDSVPPAIPYTIKVNINKLNIRIGPGTDFDITGKYTGKGEFTIIAESSGTGSKKGWGKLKSGAGWISLDYAEKVN